MLRLSVKEKIITNTLRSQRKEATRGRRKVRGDQHRSPGDRAINHLCCLWTDASIL